MLWTDIQQSIYTADNLFSNNPISYNEGSISPTNNSLQNKKIYTTQLQQQQPYQRFTNSQPNSYYSNSEDPSINTRTTSISSTEEDNSSSNQPHRTNKRKSPPSNSADDEKRRNFLERNRQAALKCRQRKKQWLHNLQERVEFLANDNEQLQIQASLLRDEVLNLRALLMTHKNCPLNNNSNKISMSLLLQQQPQLQQSLNTQPLLHQQQPKEVQYTKMK